MEILKGNERGLASKMLSTGRPPPSLTSTCARSSKRRHVCSLIQRESRPAVSITSPNGANASAVSAVARRIISVIAWSLCPLRPSEQSDSAEAAVRMNVDPHVRNGPDIEQLCSKLNDVVRLQELRFQQRGPEKTLAGQIRILYVAQQCGIDGYLMRVVAFEVGRIDFNMLDAAGMTQAENDPIGPRLAPPTGFPTVRHARGTAR